MSSANVSRAPKRGFEQSSLGFDGVAVEIITLHGLQPEVWIIRMRGAPNQDLQHCEKVLYVLAQLSMEASCVSLQSGRAGMVRTQRKRELGSGMIANRNEDCRNILNNA